MPSGVYVRTEKTRKILSDALRDKHLSEKTKRKISEALKGRKLSERWRKKISETKRGHLVSEETRKKISIKNKGRTPPNKGKPMSEEQKLLLSQINRGEHLSEETKQKMSKRMMGERNPRWKGGITPINSKSRNMLDYRMWRKSILERDNFTCVKCGQRGGKLNTHHINNFAEFPELRFAIDNGITLCRNCHKEFHEKYGRKNNTKEQLEEFINER